MIVSFLYFERRRSRAAVSRREQWLVRLRPSRHGRATIKNRQAAYVPHPIALFALRKGFFRL